MPIKPEQDKMKTIAANRTLTSDAVTGWLKYGQRYYTKRTLQQYKMVTAHFGQIAPKYVSDITVESIEKYLDSVLATFSPRTANGHLVTIKSFCRWAADRFHISNPAAKIHKFVPDPPHQRVLSDEEYQAVLKVAKGFESEAIQFLGNTGLRKSEFQSITWENIFPDFSGFFVLGKGRKQRIVPLNAICQKLLKKYEPNHNTYIPFVQKYQTAESLYYLCQRLAKRAGIPGFGPHAVRHFFATRLVRAGVPLIKVSRILGHSSVQITEQIYIHLLPQDFMGATDVLTS